MKKYKQQYIDKQKSIKITKANMTKNVSFYETVEVFYISRGTRCTKAEKIVEWNRFGKEIRAQGLCVNDTLIDIVNDAFDDIIEHKRRVSSSRQRRNKTI